MNWQNSTPTDRARDDAVATRHGLHARRLPAEQSRQAAVAITWPHEQTDWHSVLHEVESCYVAISAAIARHQNVLIIVADEQLKTRVLRMLAEARAPLPRISCTVLPYDDTWIRDYGPICVMDNNTPLVLDFQFNGWGGRFDARRDNRVTAQLHKKGWLGEHRFQRLDWVLEGGAIDSDGQGSLLTTARCVCNPNRNKDMDKGQMEAMFQNWFGVNRVLWLEDGCIEGDDTDGHIDQLARFCGPGTIAYCASDGSGDEQSRSLEKMAQQLRTFTRADGQPYRLIALPAPRPILGQTGERLPASYANFLIINDAVLVPAYGDPADQIALRRLQRCFPDRRAIQVPARALLEQGGSIHCATMQLPAGVFTRATATTIPV